MNAQVYKTELVTYPAPTHSLPSESTLSSVRFISFLLAVSATALFGAALFFAALRLFMMVDINSQSRVLPDWELIFGCLILAGPVAVVSAIITHRCAKMIGYYYTEVLQGQIVRVGITVTIDGKRGSVNDHVVIEGHNRVNELRLCTWWVVADKSVGECIDFRKTSTE